MFNFSGSFHFPVSLPKMISICGEKVRLPGVRRGGKGNPWPHDCPWACTGPRILTGTHLLTFAATALTLYLDSSNLVRPGISHWMTTSQHLHPPNQSAAPVGLSPIVPHLPCHTSPGTGQSPLSLASVPHKDLRDLPSSHLHPTSAFPDNSVLLAPCYSQLPKTLPQCLSLNMKRGNHNTSLYQHPGSKHHRKSLKIS